METRKVINPHDEITIGYDDVDAARIALLIVGAGAYCIEGDDMPLFVFGGSEEWVQKTYNMPMGDWLGTVSKERICAALESMAIVGYRSSMSDPVGNAHKVAARMREKIAAAPQPVTPPPGGKEG